jgi:sugar transferase (PEP-CTERM system associated)
MSKQKPPADAGEVALPLLAQPRSGVLAERVFGLLRYVVRRWLLWLMLGELLLLSGSLWMATWLRFSTQPAEFDDAFRHLFARSVVFGVAMMLGMAALGLYERHLRHSAFGFLARQALGFTAGTLGLLALYYALPPVGVGRGILAIATLTGFVLVACFRAAFLHIVDARLLRRRVLVLGAGAHAALIAQTMRRRVDRRGFTVVGFVVHAGEAVKVPAERVVAPDAPLWQWAERQRINEIVIGPDERRGGLPMEELLACKQAGVEIVELATFVEREAGKVPLNLADPSWLVFSQGFDMSPLRLVSKRAFDLAVALAVSCVTWPLLLLVALAIRLESGPRQPILYFQERVGIGGRVFRLIKFRSMRTDAERDGVARWAGQHDDRVTHTGRVIRRLRLDELPQLWNILRGDMSLIGPRPERPEFVAGLAQQIRYYHLRHCVKPGLAGWAQLRYPYGASVEDAVEKLKYDLFYVKNHTLLLDLLILIQTFEVVLFGRGVR